MNLGRPNETKFLSFSFSGPVSLATIIYMGKYGGQHRGKAVGGAAKSTNPFLGLLDDLFCYKK